MPAVLAGSPSPRRPIVVTFTTEYKYGEFAEIIGKLGKSFWGMFSEGCGGGRAREGLTKRQGSGDGDQRTAGSG
jgi:hypothetical protein